MTPIQACILTMIVVAYKYFLFTRLMTKYLLKIPNYCPFRQTLMSLLQIKCLLKVGGISTEDTCKNVLTKLLTNEAARNLLWTSANGKMELQKMKLARIVYGMYRIAKFILSFAEK